MRLDEFRSLQNSLSCGAFSGFQLPELTVGTCLHKQGMGSAGFVEGHCPFHVAQRQQRTSFRLVQTPLRSLQKLFVNNNILSNDVVCTRYLSAMAKIVLSEQLIIKVSRTRLASAVNASLV